MEEINCIIIDDEEASRNNLKTLLMDFCDGVEVAAMFESPTKARAYLMKNSPDAVFLDIHMNELTGFQLLETIPERNFEVVVVSGHDGYGMQAIQAEALHYLLKPISISELQNAIKRIRKRVKPVAGAPAPASVAAPPQEAGSSASEASGSNGSNKKSGRHITMPTRQGFIMIQVADITYLQADSNYTHVYRKSDKSLLISRSLKEFEELLADEPSFVRVSRTYLINLAHLAQFSNQDGGTAHMTDGYQIPIARRRVAAFHEAVKSYTHGQQADGPN